MMQRLSFIFALPVVLASSCAPAEKQADRHDPWAYAPLSAVSDLPRMSAKRSREGTFEIVAPDGWTLIDYTAEMENEFIWQKSEDVEDSLMFMIASPASLMACVGSVGRLKPDILEISNPPSLGDIVSYFPTLEDFEAASLNGMSLQYKRDPFQPVRAGNTKNSIWADFSSTLVHENGVKLTQSQRIEARTDEIAVTICYFGFSRERFTGIGYLDVVAALVQETPAAS